MRQSRTGDLLRRTTRLASVTLVAAVVSAAASAPAGALTHTWQGPSDGDWSNAGNWTNGIPTTGESGGTIVAFPSDRDSNMDLSSLTVDRITLAGTNSTINDGGGAPLGIANGGRIDSAQGGNAVNVELSLAGGAKITVGSSAGTFDLGSDIAGASGAVVEFVSGGAADGTHYTGALSGADTVVTSGFLTLDKTGTPDTTLTGPTVSVGEDTPPGRTAELKLLLPLQIGNATDVMVGPNGLFNMNDNTESVHELTVTDGEVDLDSAQLRTTAGSGGLDMTGGTIDGSGSLNVAGLTATSSPSGPARIKAPLTSLLINGAQLGITVPTGITQPELEVSGGIRERFSSAGGYEKLGAGTVVVSGTNTLPGAQSSALPGASVDAGTLVMNGSQTSGAVVASGATLTGTGSVGDTDVSGRLAPGVPGLATANLRFKPTGELKLDAAGATVPRVSATGTVTIDSGAQLNLTLPNAAVPAGTQHALIANDGADAVAGQFANAPDATVFPTPAGVPFTVGYATGDGNDLTATAANVTPAVVIRPAQDVDTSVGSAVPFGADASDANGDSLSFTWDYGDGTTGSGSEASHAYSAPGTFTARVTVDDGHGATTTTTRVVRVTGPPPGVTPRDTLAPKLTFAVAKKQRLSKKGTYKVKLTCNEDCTVTLSASIKPPGRGAKTSKTRKVIKLKAGKATTVTLTVPRSGLTAVRKALAKRKPVTVKLTAAASDTARNAGKAVKAKSTLKP